MDDVNARLRVASVAAAGALSTTTIARSSMDLDGRRSILSRAVWLSKRRRRIPTHPLPMSKRRSVGSLNSLLATYC